VDISTETNHTDSDDDDDDDENYGSGARRRSLSLREAVDELTQLRLVCIFYGAVARGWREVSAPGAKFLGGGARKQKNCISRQNGQRCIFCLRKLQRHALYIDRSNR
jgi:hypothetical protein